MSHVNPVTTNVKPISATPLSRKLTNMGREYRNGPNSAHMIRLNVIADQMDSNNTVLLRQNLLKAVGARHNAYVIAMAAVDAVYRHSMVSE
jgi:hypothetical protein